MCHSMCGNWKGGCTVSLVVKVLLVVGAVNWGLVGVGSLMGSNWNVVNLLLGSWSVVEAIVYILVGVAGVASIFGCKCKKCAAACASCGTENSNPTM
jgi:uncharacterized membrane protein YuzA (DUF378 family)